MTSGEINARGQIGPYPSTGEELKSTQRGPARASYRSGKPDNPSIEKNVKNIKFDSYQFVVETTMGKVDHDDFISLMLGGTHRGSGWFVTGVSFKEGQCCLGTEPEHPETHLCIIKGPKIGTVLNKKIKIAAVYFKKRNHLELWTNIDDGWKKQCEGTNVGGFNPNSDINEAQERIDGFVREDVPQLHMAIVQEIVE